MAVMFPSFLAASVRNHRWRLVPLAFVFAVGVATVMLPVTLGLSLLTESLLRYHTVVYGVGAPLLLLGLAVISLGGGTWSLPLLSSSPVADEIEPTDAVLRVIPVVVDVSIRLGEEPDVRVVADGLGGGPGPLGQVSDSQAAHP